MSTADNTATEKQDVYSRVTSQIINAIETGVKADPDIRNNSGDTIRFQDRPTVAVSHSYEERNARPRGHDVASVVNGRIAQWHGYRSILP
jgi:hypothetical protein